MENYPENGNQYNETADMGNVNTEASAEKVNADAVNNEETAASQSSEPSQKFGTCPPGYRPSSPYNGSYNYPPVNPNPQQYNPPVYPQNNGGNYNNAGTSPYTSQPQNRGNYNPGVPPYVHNGAQNNCDKPSDIYNNSQNSSAPFGGAPQYHYGRPVNFMDSQYYAERQAQNMRRREQQKDIKKLATIIAFTMGGFLCVSFAFSLLLSIFGLADLYNTNSTFSSAFGVLYSVFAVGVPFFIAKKVLTNAKFSPTIPFNTPKDAKKTVLLLLIGFGSCMAANYIVSIIASFFEGVGIHFEYSEGASPKNLTDVILLFIGTAVIPPLVEEFAMRGVVMQSLRKYGNSFAILSTAFCFGIFHGNPTQIPFAFICGLLLSYVVVASGSIWTGVLLHFLVNSTSCIQQTLELYGSENSSTVFWVAILAVGVIVGIASLVIYTQTYRNEKVLTHNMPSDLTLGEKFKKFVFNPAMIIIVIIFVFEALSFVSLNSAAY